MEIASFRPVSEFKAVADAVFEEQKRRILDWLPFASVHHIGSTAIPNSVTKGDLDMNVQVDTDNFASFKDGKNLAIDFGVQLTVVGSPDDAYVSNRDFLLKHPEVVEQLML